MEEIADGANDFEERREALRLSISCPVVVHHPLEEYNEKIRNLSPSGMRLQTKSKLSVNGKYGLEFTLPGGPEISLEGEVLWRRPRGEGVFYGIKFSQIGVLAKLRLMFFLHRTAINIKKDIEVTRKSH